MKRSAPMKRVEFKRTPKEPSFSRPEHPRAKEASAKPVSAKTCAHCGKPFLPFQSTQKVCATLRCAKGYAQAQRKVADRQIRERREKLKTITEWEHECKAIVQKIARLRDRADGCISCHMGANYAGQWHGSHFRPAGNHSAVELHLWNIHKACAQCNKYKGGNIAGYRPRLIEKIGLARVEWLESQNQVTRRSVDYLKRFKRVMGKRLRRMEKRIQQQ